MKATLLKRLSNLLTIKSLVTLSLLGVFIYLAIKGVTNEQVNNIFTTVIAFYFGSKIAKEE